jgi:RNA polymerase sigma factor (sigma-70 family)
MTDATTRSQAMRDLIVRARAGDASALETVLDQTRSLVVALATRFTPRGTVEADDLVQEGRIALLLAVRSYDPAGGASLTSYAWGVVRWQLLNTVAAESAARVPAGLAWSIRRALRRLKRERAMVTKAAVAVHAGVGMRTAARAIDAMQPAMSIEAIGDLREGDALRPTEDVVFEAIEIEALRALVVAALACVGLSRLERLAVNGWMADESHVAVAAHAGISPAAVRNAFQDAKRKLRPALAGWRQDRRCAGLRVA